jgi:hypothetical protein
MIIPTREETMKKWTAALGSMGVTGSQLNNLDQLAENQSNHIVEETKTEEFTLLPIAMKIAAKTIGDDLIFATKDEIDGVKSRVKSENRDGKIEAIIEGGEFTEKKLEDDEEYKKLMGKVTPMPAPSSNLFYLDFKYDNDIPKTHKKTRRSKKK